jgi:hypothetical protein
MYVHGEGSNRQKETEVEKGQHAAKRGTEERITEKEPEPVDYSIYCTCAEFGQDLRNTFGWQLEMKL